MTASNRKHEEQVGYTQIASVQSLNSFLSHRMTIQASVQN